MQKLRDKIARLSAASPLSDHADRGSEPSPESPARPPAAERVEKLRALLQGVAERQERPRKAHGITRGSALDDDARRLPGSLEETDHGSLHVVRHDYEPNHQHGRVRVADSLSSDPALIAALALDTALSALDPRRLLFVDTETTGLAGGTGTLPFLVGLGWFEDESLRVEQLFLRRPGEEGPILARVAERFAAASCVVTFNGKSFDWPLLRTRFVMNRVPCPTIPPHLDLLHCARRVFGPRLRNDGPEAGGLRLAALEARVLGFLREDDIHGSEIPASYLAFLRHGDARGVEKVIEHNAHDIVALPALLATLVGGFSTLRPEDDPWDQLAMARVALRASDVDRAMAFAHAAAEGGAAESVTVEALHLHARVARRVGKHLDARTSLETALAVTSKPSVRADTHLALAKLLEHRLREPSQALDHAYAADGAEDQAAKQKRIRRLERRSARRKTP